MAGNRIAVPASVLGVGCCSGAVLAHITHALFGITTRSLNIDSTAAFSACKKAIILKTGKKDSVHISESMLHTRYE